MVEVLENKRTATTLRVLVEIAERQPAVSQSEIADAVGVTNQAVSEYIQDLIEEGYVTSEARSRYRITNEGVDWLYRTVRELQAFSEHVTDDVLGGPPEDAAIAATDLAAGETVTLRMVDGLPYADPEAEGAATGETTGRAAAGEAVGVTGFEGVIELDPGHVTVRQVPPVRADDTVDVEALVTAAADADIVVAAGVEAVVACRSTGIEPAVYVAGGAVAAAAAERGLDVLVVATRDAVGRVTDPLRDRAVSYDVA
ncbi:MAG: winged helix-turn-helix transcriptional regulator [Halococcoides sp.]